jgi:hypothetical protein
MSLGYIGYCKKTEEDEDIVIYAYSGSDWNNPDNDSDSERAYDGKILIVKFGKPPEKPEQTEFISMVSETFKQGGIEIQPCKNAFFRFGREIDYIAYSCLLKIFIYFCKNGVFPEKEAFIQ